MCECSSVGRASRCQRDCRRFDSGHSLQIFLWHMSGRLAQSVEQGTENPRVPSSILGPATIFLPWCRMVTRHSAFFVPVFEVELQGFISISAKQRIWKVGIPEVWNPSKSPKFSVWQFLGDTGICLVVSALFAAHFLKILSFFLVSPMSAKENFVLRTIVLWVFSLTIKELQSNQRFLFSTQMHTREQILRCHRLPFLIFAASSDFIVQSGIEFHFSRRIW